MWWLQLLKPFIACYSILVIWIIGKMIKRNKIVKSSQKDNKKYEYILISSDEIEPVHKIIDEKRFDYGEEVKKHSKPSNSSEYQNIIIYMKKE